MYTDLPTAWRYGKMKRHSMFTPSKTVIARERLLEQQNQRITHHYNEMSPDEIRLFEHTFLEEFFTKNPDLKPMGGIDISWCKVLAGITIIHTPLSVCSIVPASIFHNAELHHIAIISHRRSTYNLLKARGKRNGSSVFLTFVLVANFLRNIYGPFSSIRGVFHHTMSNNIDNIVGVENSNPKFEESHLQRQQSARLVNGSDNVAVLKRKQFDRQRQKSSAKAVPKRPCAHNLTHVIESLWFMRQAERTEDQQAILEITATNYLQEQVNLYNGRRSKYSPQLTLQMVGDDGNETTTTENLPSQIQRKVDHCNKVYFKDQQLKLFFEPVADAGLIRDRR